MDAINQTLKYEGITLIQGPPGTGKTTLVLGTISVLLNSFKEKEKIILHAKSQQTTNGFKKEKQEFLLQKRPWYHRDYLDWRDSFPLENQNKSYQKANFTDQIVDLGHKKKSLGAPNRILICAPSNAAIDEIIRKILEKGLFNSEGNRINPQLIRIGPNFDDSLQKISFDYLVDQEASISMNSQ